MKQKSILMFVLLTIISGGALFLTSCTPAAPSVKKDPIPAWFLSTAPGDPRYFYGNSNHSNKSRAVELALKDIASIISVSIKSTSSSQSFKSGLTTSSKFSENIESEVKKIEFSNYEIEHQALVNHKYYIRLKVLKNAVTENTKQKFDDLDRKNRSNITLATSLDKLDKLFQLKKSEKSLTDAYNLLILLRSLQRFDAFAELEESAIKADLLRYESYFESFQTLLRGIRFSVRSNAEFEPIAKAIRQALTDENIKNSSGSGNRFDGIILIDGNSKKAIVQSYKSITYYATVSVKKNDAIVSTTEKKVIGYSVQSYEDAAENAFQKFLKLIKKDGGILKMLKL